MTQGYLVDEASIRSMRDMRMRLGWEPLNRVGKRARWPIGGSGGSRLKYYRLQEGNIFHRGSHPNGAAVDEYAITGTDNGRATLTLSRSDLILYVGPTFRGAYIQRGGTFGNNPGDPDGGGEDEPPPCPPNCIFNPHGAIVTADSPEWWTLGSSNSPSVPGGSASATIFAIGGFKAGGKIFAETGGEPGWVAVTNADFLSATSYGSVLLDGQVEVDAWKMCSEGISSGTPVYVIYRELSGIGGFSIIGPICCPGFTL